MFCKVQKRQALLAKFQGIDFKKTKAPILICAYLEFLERCFYAPSSVHIRINKRANLVIRYKLKTKAKRLNPTP